MWPSPLVKGRGHWELGFVRGVALACCRVRGSLGTIKVCYMCYPRPLKERWMDGLIYIAYFGPRDVEFESFGVHMSHITFLFPVNKDKNHFRMSFSSNLQLRQTN